MDRIRREFEKYMRVVMRAFKKYLKGPVIAMVHCFGDDSLGDGRLYVHVHFICEWQDYEDWMGMREYLEERGFGFCRGEKVKSIFRYLLGYSGENTLEILGVNEDGEFVVRTKHGSLFVFGPEEALNLTVIADLFRHRKLIRTFRVPRKRVVWTPVDSRVEAGMVLVEKVREWEEGIRLYHVVRFVMVLREDLLLKRPLVLLRKPGLMGKGKDPPLDLSGLGDAIRDGLDGELDRITGFRDRIMERVENLTVE